MAGGHHGKTPRLKLGKSRFTNTSEKHTHSTELALKNGPKKKSVNTALKLVEEKVEVSKTTNGVLPETFIKVEHTCSLQQATFNQDDDCESEQEGQMVLLSDLQPLYDKPINWDNVDRPKKTNLLTAVETVFNNFIKPDLFVRIGNHHFNCHLMVLQTYATYFNNCRYGQTIYLPKRQVPPKAFSGVYMWMLKRENEVEHLLTRRNILDVLLVTLFLNIPELEEQCWAFIDSPNTFVEETAFLLYLDAMSRKMKSVMELMKPRISRCFLPLIGSDVYDRLPLDVTCMLLSSSTIQIHSEIEVFMAAMKWLLFDWSEREKCAVQVMKCVRFGLMAPWQLVDIRRNPKNPEFMRVTDIPEVKIMLNQAAEFSVYRTHYARLPAEYRQSMDKLGLSKPEPRNWIGEDRNYTTLQEFLEAISLLPAQERSNSAERTYPPHGIDDTASMSTAFVSTDTGKANKGSAYTRMSGPQTQQVAPTPPPTPPCPPQSLRPNNARTFPRIPTLQQQDIPVPCPGNYQYNVHKPSKNQNTLAPPALPPPLVNQRPQNISSHAHQERDTATVRPHNSIQTGEQQQQTQNYYPESNVLRPPKQICGALPAPPSHKWDRVTPPADRSQALKIYYNSNQESTAPQHMETPYDPLERNLNNNNIIRSQQQHHQQQQQHHNQQQQHQQHQQQQQQQHQQQQQQQHQEASHFRQPPAAPHINNQIYEKQQQHQNMPPSKNEHNNTSHCQREESGTRQMKSESFSSPAAGDPERRRNPNNENVQSPMVVRHPTTKYQQEDEYKERVYNTNFPPQSDSRPPAHAYEDEPVRNCGMPERSHNMNEEFQKQNFHSLHIEENADEYSDRDESSNRHHAQFSSNTMPKFDPRPPTAPSTATRAFNGLTLNEMGRNQQQQQQQQQQNNVVTSNRTSYVDSEPLPSSSEHSFRQPEQQRPIMQKAPAAAAAAVAPVIQKSNSDPNNQQITARPPKSVAEILQKESQFRQMSLYKKPSPINLLDDSSDVGEDCPSIDGNKEREYDTHLMSRFSPERFVVKGPSDHLYPPDVGGHDSQPQSSLLGRSNLPLSNKYLRNASAQTPRMVYYPESMKKPIRNVLSQSPEFEDLPPLPPSPSSSDSNLRSDLHTRSQSTVIKRPTYEEIQQQPTSVPNILNNERSLRRNMTYIQNPKSNNTVSSPPISPVSSNHNFSGDAEQRYPIVQTNKDPNYDSSTLEGLSLPCNQNAPFICNNEISNKFEPQPSLSETSSRTQESAPQILQKSSQYAEDTPQKRSLQEIPRHALSNKQIPVGSKQSLPMRHGGSQLHPHSPELGRTRGSPMPQKRELARNSQRGPLQQSAKSNTPPRGVKSESSGLLHVKPKGNIMPRNAPRGHK